MRRLFWVVLVAVFLSGCSPRPQEEDLRQQVVQLQMEKYRLAGQVAELDKQLRELEKSHELYILVVEDMDKRLVNGPAWRE